MSEKFAITIFTLPFVLFALLTMVEGYAGQEISLGPLACTMPAYPVLYTVKVLLMTPVILLLLRYWHAAFPVCFTRKSLLAVVAGMVGVVLWVGVCKLELERKVMAVFSPASVAEPAENDAVEGKNSAENSVVLITPDGAKHILPPPDMEAEEDTEATKNFRSGFNPFTYWPEDSPAWRFFIIRMLGLALLVPLMEEFFLRGFLLRFLTDQDRWMTLSVGTATPVVWIATAVYAGLTHPGEMVAAVLWFGMITWLVTRTKNIWDAVTAHAVTNFLLGMYVLYTGDWYFL